MRTSAQRAIHDVADLTDPGRNVIFNMPLDEARRRVASGDGDAVREIDGHFALVARDGASVRMARSLAIPMRYFIAKQADGPALVVAHRIDAIRESLAARGMGDQFHPSYTRMAPAHYVTEIALVGCPDPNPVYRRFFTPERGTLPAEPAEIGRRYIGALRGGIDCWLDSIPASAPIGVCFSGGIDSGAVFLVTYHTLLARGMNPGRLKAFTLAIDGAGEDLVQARRFLESLGLGLFLEAVEVASDAVDFREAVRVVEDYKPLDVQAAAMLLALCRGIRARYPDWEHLIDGDGGDENLKDYPIEENPELTIRSVLNNPMLYQEGWGVESIKHSLTYSGGLSRACTRTFAPLNAHGFVGFSPFTLPSVVAVAEGIPFIELTAWDHERLYALKGKVVAAGVETVTGIRMPIFGKRRFQHGAGRREVFERRFPAQEMEYRRIFASLCHA